MTGTRTLLADIGSMDHLSDALYTAQKRFSARPAARIGLRTGRLMKKQDPGISNSNGSCMARFKFVSPACRVRSCYFPTEQYWIGKNLDQWLKKCALHKALRYTHCSQFASHGVSGRKYEWLYGLEFTKEAAGLNWTLRVVKEPPLQQQSVSPLRITSPKSRRA